MPFEPPSKGWMAAIFINLLNIKSMSNFNRKKIHISYMLGLRNQEFPEVFGSICTILERAEITEPYLAECLQLAKTKESGLKFLKNLNRKHLLTSTISELTRDRHDYYLSLRGKAAYSMKSPIVEERNAGRMLVLWLDGYREHLLFAKRHGQNLLCDQLADDIANNASLDEAMDKVGLSAHFNSIKSITTEIRMLWSQRSEDLEAQSREADLVRRQAYEVMKRVINALDMAIMLDGEDSARYVGYWNEIAKLLDQFNAKVLSRSTRRRNAAEEDELESPVEGEVNGEEENLPEGEMNSRSTPNVMAAMHSKPYRVMGLDEPINGDLHNLEEEMDEWDTTEDAMMGSGILNDDDAKASNNGSAAKADEATEDDATGHSDADADDSNQESGDE